MSFHHESLRNLINGVVEQELAARSPDVQKAYNWLVENSEQHLAQARMVITSDWEDVGLLTPCAYIMKDPRQSDMLGLSYSTIKITWAPGAGVQREVPVERVVKT
ncbi:MAG: hypothetical protein LQ341_002621, partial [Variospora aurantia]